MYCFHPYQATCFPFFKGKQGVAQTLFPYLAGPAKQHLPFSRPLFPQVAMPPGVKRRVASGFARPHQYAALTQGGR